ncbi:MAG: helix-turn-helix domain-containing protein [Planctomycetes bacterium]|nr:helix-turn-helix domain-containing protein [Planctomycetota bacterium]
MPIAFVVGFRHELASGRACGLHAHAVWEMVYHPRGSGVTHAGGHELAFQAGDVVLYPPRVAHDQVMSSPGEDWCVQVRGFTPPPELNGCCWAAHLAEDPAAVAELAWLTTGSATADVALASTRVHAVLHAALARRRGAGPAIATVPASMLARRAARLAADRGHEIDGVAALARMLGSSSDWLRHACARAGVESPQRMLTRARLARAQALLAHTGLTIAEIARQSGYRDDRYLVAVFRRELGCTPGQLRGGRSRALRGKAR